MYYVYIHYTYTLSRLATFEKSSTILGLMVYVAAQWVVASLDGERGAGKW